MFFHIYISGILNDILGSQRTEGFPGNAQKWNMGTIWKVPGRDSGVDQGERKTTGRAGLLEEGDESHLQTAGLGPLQQNQIILRDYNNSFSITRPHSSLIKYTNHQVVSLEGRKDAIHQRI